MPNGSPVDLISVTCAGPNTPGPTPHGTRVRGIESSAACLWKCDASVVEGAVAAKLVMLTKLAWFADPFRQPKMQWTA